MSVKSTVIAGAFGAAAIYLGRQVLKGGGNPLYSSAKFNDKNVPVIPPDAIARNGWSGLFWIIPAAGAYYLSK